MRAPAKSVALELKRRGVRMPRRMLRCPEDRLIAGELRVDIQQADQTIVAVVPRQAVKFTPFTNVI